MLIFETLSFSIKYELVNLRHMHDSGSDLQKGVALNRGRGHASLPPPHPHGVSSSMEQWNAWSCPGQEPSLPDRATLLGTSSDLSGGATFRIDSSRIVAANMRSPSLGALYSATPRCRS